METVLAILGGILVLGVYSGVMFFRSDWIKIAELAEKQTKARARYY
jgi:hypothetical protein